MFRQGIMKLIWVVETQTQPKPSLMEAFEDVCPHFSRKYSGHQVKLEKRLRPLSDYCEKTVGFKWREVFSVQIVLRLFCFSHIAP